MIRPGMWLVAMLCGGARACAWADGEVRPPETCDADCTTFKELHQSNRGKWNWNYYMNVSSLLASSPLWSTGRLVEIGTAWGGLALHLLDTLPKLRVTAVDPFLGGYDRGDLMSNFLGKLQARHGLSAEQVSSRRAAAMAHELHTAHGCRYRLRNAKSTDAAPSVANGSVAVLFIDGDHTLHGVLADIAAWLPKVAPGGLVLFNDFGGPFRHKYGVRAAVWRSFGGGSAAVGPGAKWAVFQSGAGETNAYVTVPESGNGFME